MTEADADSDGKVTGQEFQKVFAVLQRTQDMGGARGAAAGATYQSAGVRPTVFDCTLYPSFSKNFALSQYQAMDMLTAFDKDGDHKVSLNELEGVTAATPPDPATPTPTIPDPGTGVTPDPKTPDPKTPDPVTPLPPPSAAERADALIAQYDVAGKGYVTLEDIAGAWINDPSLGDISQLANVVQAWDTNSDGKITREEVLSVFTIMDAADALLGQMGQGAQDSDPAAPPAVIKIADVSDDQLTQLGVTRDDLNAWDANQNGALTRPELVEGLRALTLQQAPPTPGAQDYAQAMLSTFDADKSGALGLAEFQQAVAGSNMDASAAQDAFDAWDANHDGGVDAAELTRGVDAARRASDLMAGYDPDKNGAFDIADIQRVLDETSDQTEQATAAELMAVWDLDGDGQVTTQEVVSGLMLQDQLKAEAAATSPAA
jgi:Ca2+-binding EF-hand superfamily protein